MQPGAHHASLKPVITAMGMALHLYFPFPPWPCSPPSSLQFPAALARGASISLASLKLNGRPLLPTVLAVPQAAAADGCLVQLYRLGKAAKGSFVLNGWLGLTEGDGASGASNGGFVGPAGAFGVGEMASVEVTLGEYSLLDAATVRLFPGSGAAAAAAAAQQPGGGAVAADP